MHDQRKVRHEINEAARERDLAEVQAFTSLHDSMLRQRDRQIYSEAVLQQLSELLCKNPEAYSMYNYRRNVLLHLWREMREQQEEDVKTNEPAKEIACMEGGDTAVNTSFPSSRVEEEKRQTAVQRKMEFLKEELRLNSKILLRDYKVYVAFLHRRWIFAQLKRFAKDALLTADAAGVPGQGPSVRVECPEEVRFWSSILIREKEQCDALLAVDERNFHAWNYRRWALSEIAYMDNLLAHCSVDTASASSKNPAEKEVPKARQLQEQQPQSCGDEGVVEPRGLFFTPDELKELNFTTKMVQRNFSNYSAWHQRGLIIKTALQRLQQRLGDDVMRDATLREAWEQLEEDLTLFTTAIYCDPSDQSAWYYAQFLRRAAETLEHILPAPYAACDDFIMRPIQSCIELLTEEKRLGDEADMYWPRYYLFTSLLASCVSENSNDNVKNRTAAAVTALVRDIRRALCPNDSLSGTSDIEEDRGWCLRELAAELVRVDPMRAGMYQGLLATSTT
ncbi:geranylgeranyl transferase type-2 subunit alpha [Trypanosoma rangeli]|uniref:Geranylgeranyl transferase type-2 subunit alpha n=1 Tax=Trypanosoma rangeli TaxID=5698 RepID=A0A422P2I9_TRYRA|nr:geranylgeranyl transferase type-2 subunit alpha [Trypanosoma rangeli]RNF11919.1 geranylgeranyl transferase type-2 subunit alpha [Trypanosoma rangeli]|eukprot:RNF11919.1 geranylgeranyl transferase type-2 subunit alpha [Trypanosoma rangeli]